MPGKVSIRISLLTVLLIVLGGVSGLLIFLEYRFANELAESAAKNYFEQISKTVVTHLHGRKEEVSTLLAFLSSETIAEQPLELFIRSLELQPDFYSIYTGKADNSFYQVANLTGPAIKDKLGAPKNARWMVINIHQDIKKIQFLDGNKNILAESEAKTDYFPTKRPWFQEAKKSRDVITTRPYIFSSLDQPGITFSLNTGEQVLGFDLTLAGLESLLLQLKPYEQSEIFFEVDGEKIVSSGPLASVDIFDFRAPMANKGTFIGISVPRDILLAPYVEKIQLSVYAALVVVLFALPVIYFITSLLIKPIRLLMRENERVKKRQYDKVSVIDTHIAELYALSQSLVEMSQSVKTYARQQEELFEGFIKLISGAIDQKSSYTGGHCNRVPEIAIMLAQAASDSDDFEFTLHSDDEIREFEIAAWLHDCGKVVTPEYVVDKATKLETINNRIHEIRTRFEVLWRDIEIQELTEEISHADALLGKAKLQEDFNFVAACNIGGEFLDEDKKSRLKKIAERTWVRNFDNTLGLSDIEKSRYTEKELPVVEKLLSDKPEHIIERRNFDYEGYKQQGFKLDVPFNEYNYGELYNLCIEKGTLTPEERFVINHHIIATIQMLEQLPLPKYLERVPRFAGNHHETLIGTGYPRKLGVKDLSIPDRIIAIADIFEALTASDRPYKKAKTVSEAMKIMSFMVKDQHIDAELYNLFINSGMHLEYARKFLSPEQVDIGEPV